MTFTYSSQCSLNRSLRLWQRRLSLRDWRVTAKLVPASDLREGCLGDVDFDIPSREARIRIARVDDGDAEETLVHELLHLVAARIEDSKEMECVICQTARALVELTR